MTKRKYLKEEIEIQKLYKKNVSLVEITKKYQHINKGSWIKRYINNIFISKGIEIPDQKTSKYFNVDLYKDWIIGE